jgi:hypothetical protein
MAFALYEGILGSAVQELAQGTGGEANFDDHELLFGSSKPVAMYLAQHVNRAQICMISCLDVSVVLRQNLTRAGPHLATS